MTGKHIYVENKKDWLLFFCSIDNHYQYDSYDGYINIKGDVILIMIKKDLFIYSLLMVKGNS